MGHVAEKIRTWILFVGVALIMLEGIFVEYTVDSEYAIAQSFRMVRGDDLFLQMWEPHQTSAFLCAGLIWIWMKLTGTLTGVVLFLHFAGLILKAAVFVFLYRTLKGYFESEILIVVGIVFFAISPKGLLLPEFSNMQVYFSVCLFCCLFRFLQNQNKVWWLCLAAVSLCLEVLSYPSCILVYLIAVFFLWKCSEKKGRNILLFTGICGAAGGGFVLYYVHKLGMDVFLECVGWIIGGDDTHMGYQTSKWNAVGHETLIAVLFYFGLTVVTMLILLIRRKKGRTSDSALIEFVYLFFALLSVISVTKCFIQADYYLPREGGIILLDLEDLYPPLICLGVLSLRNCSRERRLLIGMGIAISSGGILATLLLTNLGLNHAIKYGVLALVLAIASVGQRVKEHCLCGCGKWIVYGVLFALVFRNAFLFYPIEMLHYNTNILEVRNVVRSGPAVGIFSDYMGPYIINKDMQEWKEMVRPGDNVIIVGGYSASTIAYLYEDVNICVDSTICTPTYNEKLLRYWELNPDKVPDVAVVDCWYGQLRVDENSWIMQWIYKEFGKDSYQDGTFIRCYRKEK